MSVTRIGVGIPVWQGAEFVAEALDSMLSQRDISTNIFVSVDGADHESELACRPFASDPRVRIVTQPERLGWVRNCAAALAGAATTGAPYVCLQPHDDLAENDYLRTLLEVAEKQPEAAVVYSDISAFGTYHDLIVQSDVTGAPVERQLSLLNRHFNAVAFRGLTRVSALSRVPAMSGNSCGNFACDTVWMARLARTGDLVRVPRPMYRKRYHARNTHTQWMAWPVAQKTEAWLQHCLDMLAEALCVCAGSRDVRRVVAAARARVVNDGAAIGPYQGELARLLPAERACLLQRFDDICATRFSHHVPLSVSTGQWARYVWRHARGRARAAR